MMEIIIGILLGNGAPSGISWFEMSLQVLVAVGTVGAAVAALLTTRQNRQASIQLKNERHMMVKPRFRIIGYFENNLEKIIRFDVANTGFDRTLNKVGCKWEGTPGVVVSVNELVKSND